MRDEWTVLQLKELCSNFRNDIVDGPFGANLKREHYKSNGIPVLKIQNIKPFKIVLKKMDYVDEEKAIELKRHAYKKGDIVITKLGLPLGASAIVEDIPEGIIVADLVRVRAEKIDTKFLCYHLNSPGTSAFLNSQQGGTTRPRVRISAVRELPINVPSLPEQKRIVAILDETFEGIDRAIANTEKNLANARELFESYLNGVFTKKGEGWKKKTLDELCEIARGGSPRPIKAFLTNDPNGVNWIKISDATRSTKYIFETKEKIRPEGVKRSRLVHDGDFLLSNSMSFGRPYIMRTSGCIHDGWLVLSDKSGQFDQDYLYYFLGSPAAYQQFDDRAAGSTVRNLNIDLVRSVEIPLPPLPEQKLIIEKLITLQGETKRLESIYQQKLAHLTELKQSLLQKAFSGELTAENASTTEGAVA